MLLFLRSKLWRHAASGNITGSGATTQAGQTNAGRMLWYSPIMHRVQAFGGSLRKLLESNEPLIIPTISGAGASEQARQYDEGIAEIEFSGAGATVQARQQVRGVAYVIAPISGSGATIQESGWSTATAEHVDVELEALAAILSAA
jgi:hypothetical protein